MKKSAAKEEVVENLPQVAGKDLIREVVTLLMVAASAATFLALFSFDATDLEPGAQSVSNKMGQFGAHAAYFLLSFFGKASYLLVVLTIVWSVIVYFWEGLNRIWVRAAGIFILVHAAATLEALLGGQGQNMILPGGFVGTRFADWLSPFGSTGSLLMVGTVCLVSLVLATDTLFSKLAVSIFMGVRNHVAARRQAAALARSAAEFGEEVASEEDFQEAPVAKKPAAKKTKKEPEPPSFKMSPLSFEAQEEAQKQIQEQKALPAKSEAKPEVKKVTPKAEPKPTELVAKEAPQEPPAKAEPAKPVPAIFKEKEKEKEKATDDITWRKSEKVTLTDKPVASTQPSSWNLPPQAKLTEPVVKDRSAEEEIIKQRAHTLVESLKSFGISVQVVEIDEGPVITQYELELAAGIKVQKIISLADDIAMALKSPPVRIVAPIPGKSTVGIEVPRANREMVVLRELISGSKYEPGKHHIPLFLGKNIFGEAIIGDLAKMPHLLIAGATGSGKSICINSILMSILMTKNPEEVKCILVDPKRVELSFYKDIPHLLSPVVVDMKKAAAVLDWAVNKMEERYDVLSRARVRDIEGYNKLEEKELIKRLYEGEPDDNFEKRMPFIVIVIDELADLMTQASSKEVESHIQRLAQKSRAVGIHVILATQRPSVDVITGVIKSNLPCRISFAVTSKVDSRTILDRNGAEKLLGKGDMLYFAPNAPDIQRVQGTYVDESEVSDVVGFWIDQGKPVYQQELLNWHKISGDEEKRDELFEKAVKIVLESQRGSVSLVQRALGIGYSRAARLIDQMADAGLVGEYKGSVAREVMVSWPEYCEAMGIDEE